MQTTNYRLSYRTSWMAFCLLFLASLTASFSAPPAQAGLFDMSEEQEIQAGQEVARQAIKEYGQPLPANHPTAQRVRAIGQQFAGLSTRKNIPYSYTVLQNNEVLNAFAAPGGPIFVTTKLVETAANDAELAYVLGHETAHIERKHIVEAVEKQQKVGLAVGILGSILGGSTGNIVGTIASVGWTVISSGYSRDDERESDIVGTRWMSQLGYDPRAGISMLGKLGGSGGGGISRYLATHPAPEDRQQVVQKLINDENLMDVARRRGGPRLSMSGSANTNYYGSAPTTTPSYNLPASSAGTPTYYPAPSTPPTYYPPSQTGTPVPSTPAPTYNTTLRSPLVVVDRSDHRVVMGPVNEIAQWAGARVSTNGNLTTLRLGSRELELRRYSTVSRINGRNIEMSAAADNYHNQLYAPLGIIADGLGAQASLINNGTAVRLSLNGNTTVLRVP